MVVHHEQTAGSLSLSLAKKEDFGNPDPPPPLPQKNQDPITIIRKS